MKLKTLSIKNFQGIKSLDLDFQGKNSKVFGTNAAGKTTVANAFTWLLFDRSYTDIKGFLPKPQGETGEGLHNLDTVVTAELITDDERIIKLSKEFKEKWTNKRGSVTETFSGHVTEYYIDDVPKKAGEYQDFIDSIVDKDKARILTVPLHFAEIMSWQDRRKLLLETFGDISNDEVFNSEVALLALKDEIGSLSIDDFIAKNKNILSKSTKDIEESKIRIDELKSIEKPGDDINALEKEKADLFIKLTDLQQKKASIEVGSVDTSIIDKKISDTLAELQTAQEKNIKEKQRYEEELLKANRVKQEKIDLIQKELKQAISEKEELNNAVNKISNDIESKSKEREEKLKQLDELENTKFDESNTVCQCCKRPFESEKVEEIKNNFNNKLADDIKQLTEYIYNNCSKKIIADLEKEKVIIYNNIENFINKIILLQNNIEVAEKERVVVAEPSKWWSDTISILEKEIEQLKEERQKLIETGAGAGTDHIETEINSLKAEIDLLQDKISNVKSYANTEARIESLQQAQKESINLREQAESNIELAEQFIRAKMDMLSNKINSSFNNIKFKLFDTQINGGIKEVCDILVPDGNGNNINFSVANNAGRINACIDIINFLSDKWGVRLPLFIDNAESVVKLADTETQIIELIVSEKDKKLRVEI